MITSNYFNILDQVKLKPNIFKYKNHSEDTPTANCGTSGANDYIEIVNSRAYSAADP